MQLPASDHAAFFDRGKEPKRRSRGPISSTRRRRLRPVRRRRPVDALVVLGVSIGCSFDSSSAGSNAALPAASTGSQGTSGVLGSSSSEASSDDTTQDIFDESTSMLATTSEDGPELDTTGEASEPSPRELPCVDVPAVTRELITGGSKDAIEDALANAQPGDRIRLLAGEYRDVDLDIPNGHLGSDPIVVVPHDPMDPPRFVGRNRVSGTNFMLMGLQFDSAYTGSSGRILRVADTRAATLAYLEFSKTDNIAIELTHDVFDTVLHGIHVRGHGKISKSSASAIKAGLPTTATSQRGNRVAYSRIEDVIDGRQTIAGNEGGLTLFRVTFEDSTDVVSRHSTGMRIEECVGMRRVALSGPDHVVLNSRALESIEVWSGSHDGSLPFDKLPDGGSEVYLSGHSVHVEHSSGTLRVGGDSYQGAVFVASDVTVSEHDGDIELANGATVTQTNAMHVPVDPPTLTADEVGLSAYVGCND